MSDITVVSRSQLLRVDAPSKTVSVILGGPPGPAGIGEPGDVGPAGPAGPPHITTVVLGADVANSDAVANTLSDITGLLFPVVAGTRYWFKFCIIYLAATTTTGARFTINGPANTQLVYSSEWWTGAASRFENSLSSYNFPTASNTSSPATNALAIIEGIVVPSADGNVQARLASEVASSAVTAKAGSFVEYRAVT